MLKSSVKTKVIGVDIGYEQTVFAVVDVRGNILAKDVVAMDGMGNLSVFVATLCDHILALVEQHGGYESIRSLGISSPNGNFLTGNIEHSVNLPWHGIVPLGAMMRDRLGLAVSVANDAHARAMGEWIYGSAHGMKDFVFVTLGHGFGSCLFSNGHPCLGNNGFAGEVGHCCIVPNGRECNCGGRGCLEAYCGTKGILQTAKEVLAESDRPSLMRGVADLTPKHISAFCDQGDELSIEVFRRTGFLLGIGLANYASVVNPEAIILSGGISKAGKWLFEPTDASFEQHVFHNIGNTVKIMPSQLEEDDRNILGASALAWDVKEYSLFK